MSGVFSYVCLCFVRYWFVSFVLYLVSVLLFICLLNVYVFLYVCMSFVRDVFLLV